MDRILNINMVYDKDEVEEIIHDYTFNRKWNRETKEIMTSLFRKYFADHKEEIIHEIDRMICERIKNVLIENGYMNMEDENDDDVW